MSARYTEYLGKTGYPSANIYYDEYSLVKKYLTCRKFSGRWGSTDEAACLSWEPT